MKIIEIRQSDFQTAAQLHSYLAAHLQFPAYYGSNLDALFDCLTERTKPTFIHVTLDPHALDMVSEWFDPFLVTIKDACHDNPCLFFEMSLPKGFFDGSGMMLGAMLMS